MNSSRKGRSPGNIYHYELKFGRSFDLNKDATSTLVTNIDMDGLYVRQNKNFEIFDEDSGGTVILLGPLFSWTYKDILVEFQFQWPIAQNLFGNQPPIDYSTYVSLNITF